MERKGVGFQLVLFLVLAAACDDRAFIVGGWQVRHVGPDGGARNDAAVPGPVTAATPIAGCRAYRTVGEMDQFFAARCSGGPACHSHAIPFGDLKSPDVYARVADKPTIVNCTKAAKWADTSNWSKSVLWLKSLDMPVCPDGTPGGLSMPSEPSTRLDAEELACLEGFLKALSGGK
jgi:hypothetical protein